jgi:phage antirepressor YoqD-like protein
MNNTAPLPFRQYNFTYQDKPIRMLQEDRETWFVAADICMALGLPQVSRAVGWISPASKKMVKVALVQQPNRTVMMHVIDSIGLEEIMPQGTKQAVDSFQRWLEREVVPAQEWCEDNPHAAAGVTIDVPPKPENTGSHEVSPEPVATTPADAKLPRFSRRDLLRLAVDAENECDELKQINAALLPKAKAYDRLAASKGSYSLGEVAKLLGIPQQGRNNLIKFLRRDGVLMANNVARQRFIDRGYFCVVQQDYFAADGSPQVRPVTRVFASGVEFIRSRMENYIKRQLAKPGPK